MKKLQLVAFGLATLSAACGSSSPAAPTRSLPVALIESMGNLTTSNCFGSSCSGFQFEVTNTGPGCASTLDLAGDVTLTKDDGTKSTARWTLTLGEKVAGVFKHGEVRTATRDSGDLRDTPGHGSYSITVTHQTTVACQ